MLSPQSFDWRILLLGPHAAKQRFCFTSSRDVAALLGSALMLAACAGGGGHSVPAITTTVAPPNSGDGSTATPVAQGPSETGTNNGFAAPICGSAPCSSVDAPAPASFGSNPIPAQLASPDGANFQGAYSGTFPLLFSGLQGTQNGSTAIPAGDGATITVSGSAWNASGQSPVSWQISIPSANVNDSGSELVGFYEGAGLGGPIQALSYVAMGYWTTASGSNRWDSLSASQSIGAFVFGYETPTASMPTSGQATFSGYADAAVFRPGIQVVYADGKASLGVDFSSGKISGAFTEMKGYSPSFSEPWNDVSVTAAIASGTNRFNGVTAVTSSPAGSFSMKPSATGSISGAFYGPVAQQLGAVWSLTDGASSAIGTVMAGH